MKTILLSAKSHAFRPGQARRWANLVFAHFCSQSVVRSVRDKPDGNVNADLCGTIWVSTHGYKRSPLSWLFANSKSYAIGLRNDEQASIIGDGFGVFGDE